MITQTPEEDPYQNHLREVCLKVFRDMTITNEIYKNIFFSLNCKDPMKLGARTTANSISKGNKSICEKDIITIIQFIKGDDFKNRSIFEFLFSNGSFKCGGCGGGGGGGECQINFDDYDKWLTIIVQYKNVVALQSYQSIFPRNLLNTQNDKIVKLIRGKTYILT
ncbi:hypothetical protein ACTFIW_005365 [Dictyostelium discoideum]